MSVALIGRRDAVEAFVNSAQGAATARQIAEGIFSDETALAGYELGEESHPAAVERALDRLIEQRNRTEDA